MVDQRFVVNRTYQQHPLWQNKGLTLRHLDIELTERCNNACIHCYINLPESSAGAEARELSTAEWRDILEQAAGLGALSVRFTGGEPLLREDFSDIYIHARRLGMKVRLFTNARPITPELSELFSRVPPLENIEVTVYGMTPETYDSVACAKEAYEEFCRGVDLLLDHEVPFIVKGALLPQFKDEIEAFEAWAATLPWMDGPPSYSMFFDLRARRDSDAKNKLIEKLRIMPDEGLAIMKREAERYRDGMVQFCSRFMGPGGENLFNCGAGRGGGCIDPYGKFQPCLMLRSPDYAYDLRDGNLQDALDNFFPRLRAIKATNPDYLERCACCFLKGFCEQCPAKSWSEYGTLDTPVEYLCKIAHERAQDLGFLFQGEKAWKVTDWQSRVKAMETKEG
jgi:radical SAM protein with 4Fe4S-binding SPASM domain